MTNPTPHLSVLRFSAGNSFPPLLEVYVLWQSHVTAFMDHVLPAPIVRSGTTSGITGSVLADRRGATQSELTITQLLKRSAKYWRRGLLMLSIAVSVGIAHSLLATRLYQSSTTIKISTYGPMGVQSLLDGRFMQDSLQRSYAKTQIKLLKSLQIADDVLADPAVGQSVKSYLEKATQAEDAISGPISEDTLRYRATPGQLHAYLELISVQDVKETSLVQVSALTSDPHLSRDIANAHARHFINLLRREREQAVSEAVSFLQSQAAALYQKIKQSEDTVARYAEQHSLLTLSDEEALLLKSANQITDTHAKAVTARIQLETLLNDVKDRSLDDLTLLDDSSIRALRTSLKQAEAEYADLRTKFSSEYPDVMQLRAKITSLTDLVRQQRSYALEGLRVKYQTAVDIENSLLKDLQAKRAEDRKLSGELAQYNQIKREYQNLVDLHQSVLRQLKLTQLSASSKTVTAAIREFATIATSSAYPRVPGIILLATGVGLFLGVAAAIFRQALDQDLCLTQLRDEQQVLKVLGMIPITALSTAKNPLTSKRNLKELLRIPQATQSAPLSDSSSIACSDPHNPSSDAFRSLRTAILASPEFAHPRSLLITSAGQGEGKTYISENLAISMAQSERRTLLIDADLRKTTSFSSLGLDDHSPGLCDYLLGNAPLDSIIFQSTVPNLYILPAGKPLNQPSELIHSPLMKELLKQLTGAYEYVLLESPPTAIFSDSISLGSCADAVLFVTREGMSQTPALTEAILRLKSARAHVLGFVINHVTPLYAAA